MFRALLGLLAILQLLFFTLSASAADPSAVSTFHSLGLYWSPSNASSTNTCHVSYREIGSLTWSAALPLWFDFRNNEYRGSIVNLRPGTVYEIKLSLKSGLSHNFTAETWSEEFPIAQTITLPTNSNTTLQINQSGSSSGYILYTAPQDQSSTIDVQNNFDYNIQLADDISHVIIRGLTLKSAAKHAIILGKNAHDIIIEENDISNWGRIDTDGFGVNMDSAVFATKLMKVERIIVQRNKIHHPRADTNSWTEYRAKYSTFHPLGPQAIAFNDSKGNHVFRYNEIYSEEGKYLNDIFGAGANFSFEGFPNRDSDIYGNKLSHCFDNAIESEGANNNVRIWGNYLNDTYATIGIASTSVGPLYIWRNVNNRSRRNGDDPNSDTYSRGPFIKAGGQEVDGVWYGSGRTYVFHNTVLQPPPPPGRTYTLGSAGGVISSGGGLYNLISRNNIFTQYRSNWDVFRDSTDSCDNDWDYDLYVGNLGNNCVARPHQQHGMQLTEYDQIKFDQNNSEGEFALLPSTPGHDLGILLPNFNDGFEGAAPDAGAFELNSDPMQFGVDAYRPDYTVPKAPNNLRVE